MVGTCAFHKSLTQGRLLGEMEPCTLLHTACADQRAPLSGHSPNRLRAVACLVDQCALRRPCSSVLCTWPAWGSDLLVANALPEASPDHLVTSPAPGSLAQVAIDSDIQTMLTRDEMLDRMRQHCRHPPEDGKSEYVFCASPGRISDQHLEMISRGSALCCLPNRQGSAYQYWRGGLATRVAGFVIAPPVGASWDETVVVLQRLAHMRSVIFRL